MLCWITGENPGRARGASTSRRRVEKIDFKKTLKHLYRASTAAVIQVDVPALAFLMIDGEGDPNSSKKYAEAVEALFSVSYTAKFMIKNGPAKIDYAVMP